MTLRAAFTYMIVCPKKFQNCSAGPAKGQVLLKCLFGVCNSSKNERKNSA